MNKLLILVLLLVYCACSAQYYEKPKNNLKSTRLSPDIMALSCLDGADPVGVKYGETLIISCKAFRPPK